MIWMCGTIEKKDHNNIQVRWFDGDDGVEMISDKHNVFTNLNEKDNFVALVSFHNGKTNSIENVRVVQKEDNDNLDWIC